LSSPPAAGAEGEEEAECKTEWLGLGVDFAVGTLAVETAIGAGGGADEVAAAAGCGAAELGCTTAEQPTVAAASRTAATTPNDLTERVR
jgi:hypothetical protein